VLGATLLCPGEGTTAVGFLRVEPASGDEKVEATPSPAMCGSRLRSPAIGVGIVTQPLPGSHTAAP